MPWLRPQVALRGIVGLVLVVAVRTAAVEPSPTPDPFAAPRAALLRTLRSEGIKDARVLAVMERVPRHEFVRPQDRKHAYANHALPIGGGQTISQPYVVAFMTQLLELKGDERVFEVGTGSGYQAAVLARLAHDVYSVEIDPMLAQSASERLQSLGYSNVHVRAGDGFYGWEEAAPFDAVIITAAAPRIPERLLAQLKVGGRVVMPLSENGRETLIRARKRDGGVRIERFAEVAFVPMRGAVRTPTP